MTQQMGTIVVAAEDIPGEIRAHLKHLEDTGENITFEFMTLLGCPHRTGDTMQNRMQFPTPVGHAEDIAAALLTVNAFVASDMMEPVCPLYSILAGMAISAAWRRSLLQTSTAYDLAAVTLSYIQGFSKFYPPHIHTAPAVLTFLNAWLQPIDDWTDLPSAEEVAEYLFGDVWCALRLPDQDKTAGRIAYLERPPFQPGICPAQVLATGCTLPDLGSQQ